MPFVTRCTLPFASLFSVALCVADDDLDIRLSFDQARLVVGDEEFAPIEVIAPWRDFKQVGERLFYVDGPRVVEVAADYTTAVNEVTSTDGLDLVWLGHMETTAYLAGRRSEDGYSEWDWRPQPVIRRLDLKSLTWLDSWKIELAELNDDQKHVYLYEYLEYLAEEDSRHLLGHVLVDGDSAFVLTLEVEGLEREDEHLLTYQVDAFPLDGDGPRWSRRFLSSNGEGVPIRMDPLYDTFLTYQWGTTCTPLTVLSPDYGDAETELLVCGGPTEDLVWLNTSTGIETDRVEAVWEFEPGYYGIGEPLGGLTRFGIDLESERLLERDSAAPLKDLTEADWRKIDDYRSRRSRFYEDYAPRIVAGPLLVPTSIEFADGDDGCQFADPSKPVLIVIVERGRNATHGYLHRPDTVVYKIREQAPGFGLSGDYPREYDVVNYLKLPLVPAGGQGTPYLHTPIVIDNSILWWNPDASMARIDVEDFTLDWYRAKPTGTRRGWRLDPGNTPAASSRTVHFRAFMVTHTQDQRSLKVILDAVSVADGDGTSFELRIPVSNQGSMLRVHTYVHSLEADATTLTLVVGSSSVTGRIQFELPPGLHD